VIFPAGRHNGAWVNDQHDIAGTAIDVVASGLLGHTLVHGKDKTLATVAGTMGGGYAGNRIKAAHQQAQVTSTVEHQCNAVSAVSSEIVGYDVTYVYHGAFGLVPAACRSRRKKR
jgi:uncharacterized protein YcfJ